MAREAQDTIADRPLLRVALEATYSNQQSGTGRYLSSIARELNKHADVELVIFRAPRVRRLPRAIRAIVNGLLHLIWVQIIMPIWARRRIVDLIQASMIGPAFAPCPVIVTFHDALDFHPHFRDSSLWSFYVRTIGVAAARRANGIVCVSEAACEELIERAGFDLDRTRVIWNGTNIATLKPQRPAFAARIADPFVLVVGPNHRRKNLSLAVDACERVRESHPVSLVLVGRGTQSLVEERDWIVAVEGCADSELAWLYRRARVACVPSLYEGFGLPVIEARALGTPVVASDIPALREVGGESIYLIEPGDTMAFAGAIVGILESPGEEPTGFPDTRTWADVADDLVARYREIIGGKST